MERELQLLDDGDREVVAHRSKRAHRAPKGFEYLFRSAGFGFSQNPLQLRIAEQGSSIPMIL